MDYELKDFTDWANDRISLKHNWFDRLADVVRSSPIGGPLPAGLTRWKEEYQRLLAWIKKAEITLSPKQIFDLEPFKEYWSPELLAESKKYLHESFEKSSPIKEIIEDCVKRLGELDKELNLLLQRDGPILNEDNRTKITGILDHLAERLRELPESVEWPQSQSDDLPAILVIDDLLGRTLLNSKEMSKEAIAELKELRRSFCRRFHLLDGNSSDENDEPNDGPGNFIARAYFCAGQKWDADEGFVNSLDTVSRDISEGLEGLTGTSCWVLVIADVLFNTGRPLNHGRGVGETRFGIDRVVPWLKKNAPEIPVVALTTESSDEIIHKTHQLGVEFLHRTESSHADLLVHIARGGRATAPQLRKAMNVPKDLIAEDPKMLDVLLEAWHIAQDEYGKTVLIIGETGAGKERLAKFIHDKSPRAGEKIIFVNCAKYSKELADTELFGYYAKAFTGAEAVDTPGVFHQADNGTLVLDEFADLEKEVQVKLLRTLEPKRANKRPVEPRGNKGKNSKLPSEVDVRVICCTNQPLYLVRNDLRTRVSKIIEIPPLRERPLDIVPLARYFLADEQRIGKPGLELDQSACEYLSQISLPGNARTLEQLLEAATTGKGKRNKVWRSDLKNAWESVLKTLSTPDNPTGSAMNQPHRQAAQARSDLQTNGRELSGAVSSVLTIAENGQSWKEQMTGAEIETLDSALKGRVWEAISILVEWALFREEEVPAAAEYIIGQRMRGRKPEDFVKRLFKLDRKILEYLAESQHLSQNPRLRNIIETCLRERAERP
jgi:DNA-binding NtrC family response regulator